MNRVDICARLARLDACALSDALDKLGLSGCVTGLAPLTSARRIAGSIHTVKLAAKDDMQPMPGPPKHLGTAAIEACLPGEIIVVEQRTGIPAGSWGGILSVGAQLRAVAGVIAEGLIRDADEARALDFPVFARGTTARTARGRIVESGTDIPVMIGDVLVHPGDFVLADGSGVVFFRPTDAGAVLEAAEIIARRELDMTRALESGIAITRVMGGDYEHLLEG